MEISNTFLVNLGVASFFISAGTLALFLNMRSRAARTADAAYVLRKEIQSARQELATYSQLVDALKKAYANNATALPPQIPLLRLQIDKIKLTPNYVYACEVLEQRSAGWFMSATKKARFASAFVSATMFLSMVNLLRSTKISGFMRSAKMLEDYITRRSAGTAKGAIIETFTDDYLEEAAYSIVTSMESEMKTFTAADRLFKRMEADLATIARQNTSWLGW